MAGPAQEWCKHGYEIGSPMHADLRENTLQLSSAGFL
jgi:hypothetical protein